MAVQVGEVEVKFDVFVQCGHCGYRQLAADLVERRVAQGIEVTEPVLRPDAEVEIDVVQGASLVTFRCGSCRRRRYLDESLEAVIAQLSTPPLLKAVD